MKTVNLFLAKLISLAINYWWLIVLVFFLLKLTSLSIIGDGIPPHKGDGQFMDNSLRLIGPLGVHAYSIQMPDFEMGNPTEKTYVISNLTPKRSRLGFQIFLGIHEHDFDMGRKPTLEDQKLKGIFEIRINDSSGNLILQFESAMSHCVWGSTGFLIPKGNSKPYSHILYPPDQKNYFTPTKRETYKIFFRYMPDPRLKGVKGFVFMGYPTI